MADVACFCGCLYSFEGGAGACPKCGEVAAVTAEPPVNSTGRSPGEPRLADMNGAGQNGQTAGTCQERDEADPGSPAGIASTSPGPGLAKAPVLPRTGRP
jgi:hypothetical protein